MTLDPNPQNEIVEGYLKMCHIFSGKPATLYDSAHPDWASSVRLSAASNVQPDGKKLSRYQRVHGRAEAKGRHAAAEALLDLSISDVAQDDVVAQSPEPVEVGGDLPGPNATAATSVSTSDTPSLLESTASECQRLLNRELVTEAAVAGYRDIARLLARRCPESSHIHWSSQLRHSDDIIFVS